jgi:hypothetical protein
MSSDDLTERLMLAHLEASKMDAAADYVSRGRNFAALNDRELSDAAARFGSAWANDPTNREKTQKLDDVWSEFRLRGQDPPLLAAEDRKAMRVIGKVLRDTLNDPTTGELLVEEYARQIADLFDQRRKN